MTKPSFEPIIRTQRDLAEAWGTLMGPWAFGQPSVWMLLIADDRPIPHITEIAEAVEPPDEQMVANFAEMLRELADDGGEEVRFAFLRSRSGSSLVNDRDRAWARSLYAAAAAAGVACEIVHLATKGDIRALPLDEVAEADPRSA